MTKIAFKVALFSLMILFVNFAHAAEEKVKAPCREVVEACEKAGYKIKGHSEKESKGLMVDCVNPIMAGKTPEGVQIKSEIVAACKERRDDPKRKEKWEEHKKKMLEEKKSEVKAH